MEELNEFPEKKLKELAKMPIVENKISKSKDGKYLIHKTVITDIKPTNYYGKVLETVE